MQLTQFIILPLVILMFMISKYSIDIVTDYTHGDIIWDKRNFEKNNGSCLSVDEQSDNGLLCDKYNKMIRKKNKSRAIGFYFMGIAQIIAGIMLNGPYSTALIISGSMTLIYAISTGWDNLTDIHKLGLSVLGVIGLTTIATRKKLITL